MNESSILDIISPIMVGPSSSHTAGAVRIGLLAKNIYKEDIKKVKIVLYNSYAKTGPGHGTDKGLLAGLLGFGVDNTIIKDVFRSSEASKIEYTFEYQESFTRHPNAVDFIFEGALDMSVSAKSVGGGEIVVDKINNFDVHIDGKYDSLVIVVKDALGTISKVTDIIQKNNINIASLNCERTARAQSASCCIALDTSMPEDIINKIERKIKPYLIRYVKKLV